MPEFQYTARDQAGQPVQGKVEAINSAFAAGKIRNLGYIPERIRPIELAPQSVHTRQGPIRSVMKPITSGVPLTQLAVFYRQFATLINAGLPLYQSLVSLESQTRNDRLRQVLKQCQVKVQQGGQLSEVFAEYPWIFSELQLEMIRAGEHAGALEQMLTRIADYLEQEIGLRRLISRVTLYPKLVLLFALFVIGRSIFSTTPMPAISLLIISMIKPNTGYTIWNYLNDTLFFGLEIAAVIYGIILMFRLLTGSSDAFYERYERFKFSLPGIGKVSRQFALAKFGQAFSALYAAGMPLQKAIQISGRASGSRIFMHATERATLDTQQGTPLSHALAQTGAFPSITLDMLRTGEMTGNLDAMMTKMAEYLHAEAEARSNQFAHIFGAFVYTLVAILVAYTVINFYTGYFGSIMSAGH